MTLQSEKVVLSAPMSFHGATVRIWRALGHRSFMGAVLAMVLIVSAWMIVLAWYLAFGVLLVPYRLFRRGQRKRIRQDLQHREMLAAMQRPQLPR